VRPRARRELAEWAVHQMSQRRVTRLMPIERMTLRYEHYRDPQEALRIRLRELAGSRVRYGYRRLTVLLKREGWEVNAKRIYRIYTEEGLIVRTKKRKERAQRQRVAQGSAMRPNQKWSMDFVAQRLPDGRWIRVLTVLDQYTRVCVTLLADNTLSGGKANIRVTSRKVAGYQSRWKPKSCGRRINPKFRDRPPSAQNRPIACCRSISQKAFQMRYILRRKLEALHENRLRPRFDRRSAADSSN